MHSCQFTQILQYHSNLAVDSWLNLLKSPLCALFSEIAKACCPLDSYLQFSAQDYFFLRLQNVIRRNCSIQKPKQKTVLLTKTDHLSLCDALIRISGSWVVFFLLNMYIPPSSPHYNRKCLSHYHQFQKGIHSMLLHIMNYYESFHCTVFSLDLYERSLHQNYLFVHKNSQIWIILHFYPKYWSYLSAAMQLAA